MKKHGGPLNSDEDIETFQKNVKNLPEKEVARMLNLEIRFRCDSNLRYSVSKDCYLYRQRGITNAERIANLRLLVQRPDPRSTATLDDLKNAILPNDHAMDVDHDATTQAASKDVQVSI